MPKNLGTITDPKDIITKEYLDDKLSTKANKSTTLSGYGITDAYTKNETYTQAEIDALKSGVKLVTWTSADMV